MKKCLCCGRNTKGKDDYCKNCLKRFEKLRKEMDKDKKSR